MKRKRVVSGPVHGEVTEAFVDRGPGAARLRLDRNRFRGGIVPALDETSDGTRLRGGSDGRRRRDRKDPTWFRV